jgi:hypothetical protein
MVKGMIDAAIIAVAAGTITAETGIGAVIGYGVVVALEVCERLDMCAQATAAMNNLYSIVQGALGIIESQLAFQSRRPTRHQRARRLPSPVRRTLTGDPPAMHDSAYQIAGDDPRKTKPTPSRHVPRYGNELGTTLETFQAYCTQLDRQQRGRHYRHRVRSRFHRSDPVTVEGSPANCDERATENARSRDGARAPILVDQVQIECPLKCRCSRTWLEPESSWS